MRKSKCTMSIPAIIEMYENGTRTTEIAQQANVSARHINSILKSNNVERRPRGSWLRKYTINEDYFKTWSNNMAYLLGFFVADGNMPQDLQMISYSQKDPDILERIREELGSDHRITVNEKTGVHLLNLHSKIVKNDLIEIHGLTPNKSKSVELPYVPEEYISHFIRGYFDGDGNIYARGYLASFVGGSKSFMESLIQILEIQELEPRLQSKGNYFRIYISGRKTIKQFYNWIYKDKSLYLKRKFNAFPDKDLEIDVLKNGKLKNTKVAVANRKRTFLKEYALNRCKLKTCEKIGISEMTFKSWLARDKEFIKAFESIK